MLVSLSEPLIRQHLAGSHSNNTPHELRDTSIRGLCLRIGKTRQTWCIHVVIARQA